MKSGKEQILFTGVEVTRNKKNFCSDSLLKVRWNGKQLQICYMH